MDTTLVWAEYLLRTAMFDRTLSGREGVLGTWLVAESSLRESIDHARPLHRRTVRAVELLLGRKISVIEEAEKVELLMQKTCAELEAMLGGASPIADVERLHGIVEEA